ncbi:carbon-nitrogen hydrolase family protein [Rhizobium hidalgonense]|uniref:Carbon-nitrogen hydrolase family protein n=1 Tax=Rhizobium hidalgonense TaxID=1538159 RepID=A0A2A6K5U4_9HYPH|nr:carbon-nitrogen hydrolase family protein [Rhizobium hidalgonense]MDR9774054.1 carbon-nitrogen hydrolase family protein [Rhizobium hidalgonense]MDR9810619.1 carbon-nitrogen hydrolase family protein [Rhizobium hidalgonense]MDR9819566.1 carbon-nitrogen hydrolase family protein [Rhizobium hidalgonense]PDT19801.1 nitrilase [Rhizobium hidalgonense]PON05682.1 nitrilase [Rhizobium hidalgonense]
MSFKAAAIQMCSGVDPVKNAAAMARLVREAAAQGATYVQTPEMTGMLQRDRAAAGAVLADETHDIIVKTGSELAAEFGIHMHVGSTAIALADGKIANRGFLFGPDGRILNRYDKIHMFDVDLDNGESWRESAAYTAGSEARVLSLPFAEMGFAICYDVRFPALFRAQAVAGAEVMTVPAAFTRQTGEAHWEILLRARAIENGVFVVAAAQAGRHEDGRHEDGRETFGHSMIIDPWGTVLASAGATGEAVIIAEIDPAAVKAAHDKIPNLRNGREFSVEKIAGAVAGGVAA